MRTCFLWSNSWYMHACIVRVIIHRNCCMYVEMVALTCLCHVGGKHHPASLMSTCLWKFIVQVSVVLRRDCSCQDGVKTYFNMKIGPPLSGPFWYFLYLVFQSTWIIYCSLIMRTTRFVRTTCFWPTVASQGHSQGRASNCFQYHSHKTSKSM